MADWPTTLPQKPQQSGFSATKVDGRLRTKMSEGPDKVRRRFTAVPEILSCSFDFSLAQLITFTDFFDVTLALGSLTYNWVHPISGVNSICRIQDMPATVPHGDQWTTTFKVEVLP